jgi:hypothetical protein
MYIFRCVQYSPSMSSTALITVCTDTVPLGSQHWRLTAKVCAFHHNLHQSLHKFFSLIELSKLSTDAQISNRHIL